MGLRVVSVKYFNMHDRCETKLLVHRMRGRRLRSATEINIDIVLCSGDLIYYLLFIFFLTNMFIYKGPILFSSFLFHSKLWTKLCCDHGNRFTNSNFVIFGANTN